MGLVIGTGWNTLNLFVSFFLYNKFVQSIFFSTNYNLGFIQFNICLDMLRFAGRVAVITGAGNGLGKVEFIS